MLLTHWAHWRVQSVVVTTQSTCRCMLTVNSCDCALHQGHKLVDIAMPVTSTLLIEQDNQFL